MRSICFQQLIYTGFDSLGYQLITGIHVPVKIQNIFMDKIVRPYWSTFCGPGRDTALSYLYQISPENTLLGWMYIDQFKGQTTPYFVCYYLTHSLDRALLEKLLTSIGNGPMDLIDRQYPLAFLENIELDIQDIERYKPVRAGVEVPLNARKQCILLWEQGQCINLLNPKGEEASAQAIATPDSSLSQSLNQSSQRTTLDRGSLQRRNISSPPWRGRVQLPSLLSVLKIQLNRASLIIVGVLFAGSASALILPQWIAKQSQTVEVTPESLKSAHSGAATTQSSQTSDSTLSPQSSSSQDPLTHSPSLAPFSNLNLQQPQSQLSESSQPKDSSGSANLSLSSPTPETDPSPISRSQEHLFSAFRVHESPSVTSSAESEPETSYTSQSPTPSPINSSPQEPTTSDETNSETATVNSSPALSSPSSSLSPVLPEPSQSGMEQ